MEQLARFYLQVQPHVILLRWLKASIENSPLVTIMGNHHGKVIINGETFDATKMKQRFMDLKNEVEVLKVGLNSLKVLETREYIIMFLYFVGEVR